jgi:hypothetical protein
MMRMIDKNLILWSPGNNDYIVRTIIEDDLDLLRTWKNNHRDSFFFKEFITPDMQKEWFRSYLQREHDFMMMIVHEDERIGCIGFRRLEDRVDLYNIILGQQQYARKGYMTGALDIVCMEIKSLYPGIPIMASVLKNNPAITWYIKRSFRVTKEHEDYLEFIRE